MVDPKQLLCTAVFEWPYLFDPEIVDRFDDFLNFFDITRLQLCIISVQQYLSIPLMVENEN
jgi:hypothetical protein